MSAVARSSGHFGFLFFLFDGGRVRLQSPWQAPAPQLHDGNQGFRPRSRFPWRSAGVWWDWVAEPWPAPPQNRGLSSSFASASTSKKDDSPPLPPQKSTKQNKKANTHPVHPIIFFFLKLSPSKCQSLDWCDFSCCYISWVCVCVFMRVCKHE